MILVNPSINRYDHRMIITTQRTPIDDHDMIIKNKPLSHHEHSMIIANQPRGFDEHSMIIINTPPNRKETAYDRNRTSNRQKKQPNASTP